MPPDGVSDSELPIPSENSKSPFLPRHLLDLYFRPTRFFGNQLALGKSPNFLVVAWLTGMSSVIDKVDQQILKASVSENRSRIDALQTFVGTWPAMWTVVLGFGILWGVFLWWIAGWWCKVRLHWSGVPNPDARLARLLWCYSSFVFSLVAVGGLIVQTFVYPNYFAAYEEDNSLTVVVVVAAFWSIVTIYKGAITLFPVIRWRARLWFLILPASFYVFAFGVATLLFAFIASQKGP